jgi:hypothetical protein
MVKIERLRRQRGREPDREQKAPQDPPQQAILAGDQASLVEVTIGSIMHESLLP